MLGAVDTMVNKPHKKVCLYGVYSLVGETDNKSLHT